MPQYKYSSVGMSTWTLVHSILLFICPMECSDQALHTHLLKGCSVCILELVYFGHS